jgi:hypothetical protein
MSDNITLCKYHEDEWLKIHHRLVNKMYGSAEEKDLLEKELNRHEAQVAALNDHSIAELDLKLSNPPS